MARSMLSCLCDGPNKHNDLLSLAPIFAYKFLMECNIVKDKSLHFTYYLIRRVINCVILEITPPNKVAVVTINENSRELLFTNS